MYLFCKKARTRARCMTRGTKAKVYKCKWLRECKILFDLEWVERETFLVENYFWKFQYCVIFFYNFNRNNFRKSKNNLQRNFHYDILFHWETIVNGTCMPSVVSLFAISNVLMHIKKLFSVSDFVQEEKNHDNLFHTNWI